MSASNNPFEEVERFFEQMSDQFEDASRGWMGEAGGRNWLRREEMAIDLVERDDQFVVHADLPGFERDDVDVRVTDHTLRVRAERERETEEDREEGAAHVVRSERHHRSADRSIRLPAEVDAENVSATMKNGVLTVTLPKVESETARSVDISIE